MASIRTTALWIIALAAATSLYAQDPVPHLQDLKGARGRDGEYQMQQRGYTHVRTEKSDDSAYSFWTDNRTGKCVQVRTTDGRYASIVYSPEADCHSENGGESIGVETEDRFDTLCGFTGTGDGKMHRFRCELIEQTLTNGNKVTILQFPDMEMKLRWHPQRVGVEREGMETVQAKFSTANDSHEIFVDGMTYFYAYTREEAERRLQKFNK
jgi:hypothetical protein